MKTKTQKGSPRLISPQGIQKKSFARFMAIVLGLSLLTATSFTPCRISGGSVPDCSEVMVLFQVPCFVGCEVGEQFPSHMPPAPEHFPQTSPDDTSLGVSGQVPDSKACFCCTDVPLKKILIKARLSSATPSQHVLLSPVIACLNPEPRLWSRIPRPFRQAGLSSHLPHRSTIVLIV